jgi:hypothetical protein
MNFVYSPQAKNLPMHLLVNVHCTCRGFSQDPKTTLLSGSSLVSLRNLPVDPGTAPWPSSIALTGEEKGMSKGTADRTQISCSFLKTTG